jgi:Zn-dependent peptidase ImmA (M78 family)
MKYTLNINPIILQWAREESGYQIENIIERLDVNLEKYLHWEKTGEEIPFSKLKILANAYKRQIATFFLSEVPPKNKKPKDYRNLEIAEQPLSRETLLAFRRAKVYQKTLIQIFNKDHFEEKYYWLHEYKKLFSNNNLSDDVSYWLRDKIEFSIHDQLSEKSNETCYRKWRNKFENKLGVFSFHFSLPTDEIQGFNYSDKYPFCIAINTKKYPTNSRIFTLFHEFAHLLHAQSCMCLPNTVSQEMHTELEINKFAALLLLPSDNIIVSTDPDEIYKYSKRFKVSSEVYLRRLHDLDLVSDKQFFELLEEIRKRVKPPKSGGIPISPLQKCISSRGQLFSESVINAAKNEIITYSHASEILGLKVNHYISE